jgi:hypothetical protein
MQAAGSSETTVRICQGTSRYNYYCVVNRKPLLDRVAICAVQSELAYLVPSKLTVGNAPDLYSGGDKFESQPKHRLS